MKTIIAQQEEGNTVKASISETEIDTVTENLIKSLQDDDWIAYREESRDGWWDVMVVPRGANGEPLTEHTATAYRVAPATTEAVNAVLAELSDDEYSDGATPAGIWP